jgi:nucleoside-diphosphate-sugar epimerase
MVKVLVTGGAGFVGRHVVKRLLDRGDEVHCVDVVAPLAGGLLPEAWPLFNPLDSTRFHFYHEDCRRYFERVGDTDFDYCFHLAAMVGGRLMIENNPLAVADDLSIDAEYWQWAARVGPGKTLCFSSSAAYPVRFQRAENYVLLKENMISFDGDIGMPDMSYGWAKLTCEYLARLAFQKHGLRSVVYRPFSGYGEDQDDTYPFPSICKRVLANRGRPILQVWGSGRQMRDFIHIEDCMDCIFMTMDQVHDASAVNLSTGIYTSFIEFARIAAGMVGYQPEVRGTSDKPEGVFARGGDTALQNSYGFRPKTAFQDGIKAALHYYSDRGNAALL